MPLTGGNDRAKVERVELDLLLQAVERVYGYDFRDYARASLHRRVLRAMDLENVGSISGFQALLLHDRAAMSRFVTELTVNVTEMFRDPGFFLAVREEVIPRLRTYPSSRVWVAGCSTGEEAYSLAILLEEAGLSARCRIYATDMDRRVLERARRGVFSLSNMKSYTANYVSSGGTEEFSRYYTADDANIIIEPTLRRAITFAPHNLVHDSVFNEFNLILCRNVMIYFNETLQERVLTLFHDSLSRFGVLGVGDREGLHFSRAGAYRRLVSGQKLFIRKE